MANMGHCDSLMAETWAAIYGLELAWTTSYWKVILEMDSLVLANMINEQCHHGRFIPMLHKVEELLGQEREVVTRHVYKETNFCADKLANMGAVIELGVHWLCSPPSALIVLLQTDTVGVLLPCLCNLF